MTDKKPTFTPTMQLLELMQELSQRCHGVEWCDRNEYRLYFFVRVGMAQEYGESEVTEEEVLKLHRLSIQVNGWWSKDKFGYQLHSMKEWIQIYKKSIATQ